MPSFDVVSEINSHEITNALDQANREVGQRFDFKDSGAKFEWKDKEFTVVLHAKVDFQLKQMMEILLLKLSKRGIDVMCVDPKDPVTTIATATQEIVLKHGIDQETAKKIQRMIKDSKMKVQAAIQGEKLRVTGKQRDDLQDAIALLKKAKL